MADIDVDIDKLTGFTEKTSTGLKKLSAAYYTPFISRYAKGLKPSPIRSMFHLEQTPGIISLLAGKPNPAMFPFTSLSFSARSPFPTTTTTESTTTGSNAQVPDALNKTNENDNVNSNGENEMTYTLEPTELAQALQYSETAGLKKLREWLGGLQEFSHGRRFGSNPNEGWGIFVGSGSQDLIFKAVQTLVNEGDSVLIESPVYAGVIPMFQNLHCEMIEIVTDHEGISAAALRYVLESWPVGKKMPKVLYTVPYGCNPTGMTATLERRIEVLKLAREFDLIILEDDPYFYLYYGKAPRVPSYFALEKQIMPEVGRVLRFDSFSKILSAGIRIGFASGPEAILRGIEMLTATSNLQTSSLTQMITYKLVESWGYEGFRTHTESVSRFYGEKRDVFQKAMEKYLQDRAEWTVPEAGMFFWFKLKLGEVGGDSESIIRTRAFENGVLALPGKVFLPNGDATTYVRAAFSLSPEKDVYEALRRLAAAMP